MAEWRTGVEKMRGEVTRHLHELRNNPNLSRQAQINLCRMIVAEQDRIDARNAVDRKHLKGCPARYGGSCFCNGEPYRT